MPSARSSSPMARVSAVTERESAAVDADSSSTLVRLWRSRMRRFASPHVRDPVSTAGAAADSAVASLPRSSGTDCSSASICCERSMGAPLASDALKPCSSFRISRRARSSSRRRRAASRSAARARASHCSSALTAISRPARAPANRCCAAGLAAVSVLLSNAARARATANARCSVWRAVSWSSAANSAPVRFTSRIVTRASRYHSIEALSAASTASGLGAAAGVASAAIAPPMPAHRKIIARIAVTQVRMTRLK